MPKLPPSGFSQRLHLLGRAVLLASGLAGCSAPDAAAPAGQRVPAYFDIKELLDQQVKLLSAQQLAVEKHAELRDGSAETVRVPNVKWADELQIFYQADINKAALRGAYILDSTRFDSGVTRRRYTLRGEHPNAPVKELVVSGMGSLVQLVEARIEQDNTLFHTRKHLRMTFTLDQLSSYEVRGSQKLILFDSLRYALRGQVEAKR